MRRFGGERVGCLPKMKGVQGEEADSTAGSRVSGVLDRLGHILWAARGTAS